MQFLQRHPFASLAEGEQLTREEMKAQSVTPQERQMVALRKQLAATMKRLYKEGAFDRYIAMETDFDGNKADPTIWSRIEQGDFRGLVEMAIFSVRPDIHKPLRLYALKEILKYTETPNEASERLQQTAHIGSITIHIEGYARGLPEPAPRQVTAEVVDANGDTSPAALSADPQGHRDE